MLTSEEEVEMFMRLERSSGESTLKLSSGLCPDFANGGVSEKERRMIRGKPKNRKKGKKNEDKYEGK